MELITSTYGVLADVSFWLLLPAFVGLNLAQSGLTNFCPLAAILKKAGVPDGSCCS